MMFDIKFSETSIDDLRNIYNYICLELDAEQAAKDIFNNIISAIKKLDELPERTPICQDEPWLSMGMHKMLVKKFIVYYLIEADKRIVSIARIIYGGRNSNNIMDEYIEWTD